MSDYYISQEAALGAVCADCSEKMRSLCELDSNHCKKYNAVKSVPLDDVRPVVRGEWIKTGNFDQHYQPIYECSHCHREVADYFIAKHLFCLHCGADMRPKGGTDR